MLKQYVDRLSSEPVRRQVVATALARSSVLWMILARRKEYRNEF